MEESTMDYNTLKSLTGFTLQQIEQELDRVLPKDAYSAVPGGAALTDIDPGFMREELNRLFGICGIGWGYFYNSSDVETDLVKRGQGTTNSAIVKKLTFWYKLADANSETLCAEIPSSGGSLNDVLGYAIAGAVTNAIGKAVSNIGFQKSVYLGMRSHKNVDGKYDPNAASKKPAPAAKPSPKPAAPAKKPAPGNDEIVDAPLEPAATESSAVASAAAFVIPVGNRKGQVLGDQDLKVLSWYAKDMRAANAEQRGLQAAAQILLKVRSNGHAVPA
jgi:hypothetical protein